MLTRTSEYALRAMIHLAHREVDWPIPGREIAKATSIPPKYLSKILGDLVRVGVLESSPGKNGGFRMTRPPGSTPLLQVLTPFEQFSNRRCPFGNQNCSDADPCNAHDQWKKVIESQQQFLRKTSVEAIAARMGLPASHSPAKAARNR